MTVLKPRSRMISVRLSEDEHAALTRMCTETGARSVSDLTRDAMRGLLNDFHSADANKTRTEEIHIQMQLLSRKIEELVDRLSATAPAISGQGRS